MGAPKHLRQAQPEHPASGHRALILVLLACASVVLSLIACFVAAQLRGPFSTGGWINRFWLAFFAMTAFLVGAFVVCRGWLESKPERLYLVIVLCVTTLFSWSFSARAVGWDTGIHYRNTVRFTDWVGEVETSAADEALIAVDPNLAAQDSSLSTVDAQEESLDALAAGNTEQAGTIERPSFPVGYVTAIEYVPYALTMSLCRLVGLSASRTLLLVRLTGGIFYSIVTYLGMRKLRYGKMLYAAIALLPTSVFLAAELGYSYWLFSLCLYGFATLVGMLQGSVEVRLGTLTQMLGALLLGMLPRVVYFPLIFLCLFVPTQRFPSVRAARIYRLLLVGSALLAFGVWLVPRLLTGFGTGDTRGGEVSPSAQIAYILSHPLEYAQTFARFVLPPLQMEGGAPDIEGHNLVGGFLSVEASPGLLVNYGYLPRSPWPFTAVVWAVLAWTTLTDKDPEQRMGALPGIVSLVLTFGVFVMIVTALYFDFTPVALPEIHGVQRRYLLPMLYPLLAFVGPSRLGLTGQHPRVAISWYNGIVLGCMVAVLLGSFWCSCVSLIV